MKKQTNCVKNASRLAAALLLSVSMTACSSVDRLSRIGKAPDHGDIVNPWEQKDYKPVSTPQPAIDARDLAGQPNSLWRPGSRAFFRDQRAAAVGDILTVNIKIDDDANVKNESKNSRGASEEAAFPNVLGMESSVIGKVLPGGFDPAAALSTTSDSSFTGTGEVKRNEAINLDLAAMIVQKLPNGNLVIQGSQEVLVNNEMRELNVRGIIRPEDVASDNTISHEKIAEARITYGGRGTVSDVQQPRYGQQIIDIISPF
jgi:flagellar L-ring protein precursor FlgH